MSISMSKKRIVRNKKYNAKNFKNLFDYIWNDLNIIFKLQKKKNTVVNNNDVN